MAYPDDFFQTVLEVGNAVADRYVGETALISRVHTDFRLEPGRAGDQVDLPFPGAIEFADRKNQDLNIQPLQSTRKSITLQQQPTASWEVREFDQYRAYPHLIRDQFLDPALKAGAEYLNQQIASLLTSTTFNVHTPIPSVAAVTLKLSQIKAAWVQLAQAKVPVRDHGHFTLAVNPLIYGNLAGDPDFNQASLVGVEAAETARRRALVVNQFGAEVVMDHDLPEGLSTHNSALFHRHAIGLVLRPLEVPPAATGVLGSYLNYRGIPFRLMLSYDFHRRSWIMALDFVFGLTVLRPEACCLILSNKS